MKTRRPHKSIRKVLLLLTVLVLAFLVVAPATAFADNQVKLNVTGKTLVRNKTYTLKVYNLSDSQKVVFKSENPDIATVNSDGVVTAVSNGKTSVSVYIYDSDKLTDTLTCEITVGAPAISVRITKSEITLAQGKKTLLKTYLLPYNTAEEVKFFVVDPSIASISTGGQITAKAVGKTHAFALIDNGKFDFCTITVTEPVLNEASEELQGDEARELSSDDSTDSQEAIDEEEENSEVPTDEELSKPVFTEEKLEQLPSVYRNLETDLNSEKDEQKDSPSEEAYKSQRLIVFNLLYKTLNEYGYLSSPGFFLRDPNPLLQQPFNKKPVLLD